MIAPPIIHYGWWPFGRWLECPACGREFTDARWFRFHYRAAHKEDTR
jgi:hypothetical protein